MCKRSAGGFLKSVEGVATVQKLLSIFMAIVLNLGLALPMLAMSATQVSAGDMTYESLAVDNAAGGLAAVRAVEGQVTISVQPASVSVGLGGMFEFSVWVDTGSQQVVAMDVSLDFDASCLEVVNSSGTPVTGSALTPGNAMPAVLGGRNTADNGTGKIDFSAGIAMGAAPVKGNFLLASGYFRAKKQTNGTAIAFHYNAADPRDPRNAVIADPLGNALAGAFRSGTVTIAPAAATPQETAVPSSTPMPTATPVPIREEPSPTARSASTPVNTSTRVSTVVGTPTRIATSVAPTSTGVPSTPIVAASPAAATFTPSPINTAVPEAGPATTSIPPGATVSPAVVTPALTATLASGGQSRPPVVGRPYVGGW